MHKNYHGADIIKPARQRAEMRSDSDNWLFGITPSSLTCWLHNHPQPLGRGPRDFGDLKIPGQKKFFSSFLAMCWSKTQCNMLCKYHTLSHFQCWRPFKGLQHGRPFSVWTVCEVVTLNSPSVTRVTHVADRLTTFNWRYVDAALTASVKTAFLLDKHNKHFGFLWHCRFISGKWWWPTNIASVRLCNRRWQLITLKVPTAREWCWCSWVATSSGSK